MTTTPSSRTPARSMTGRTQLPSRSSGSPLAVLLAKKKRVPPRTRTGATPPRRTRTQSPGVPRRRPAAAQAGAESDPTRRMQNTMPASDRTSGRGWSGVGVRPSRPRIGPPAPRGGGVALTKRAPLGRGDPRAAGGQEAPVRPPRLRARGLRQRVEPHMVGVAVTQGAPATGATPRRAHGATWREAATHPASRGTPRRSPARSDWRAGRPRGWTWVSARAQTWPP